MKRPSFGKVGRSVNMFSNFFQVQCSAGAAYHYDVAITSARKAKEDEEGVYIVLNIWKDHQGVVWFWGINCIIITIVGETIGSVN